MKYYKGSISIYFTFSIVLIISIILSVTELSRMSCQKLYLQIATDTSLDSMLSLYHRKLYEYYNVYGVEYLTDELLTTEYLSYMNPYFYDNENNRNVNNWYIGKISEENIDLKKTLLIDDVFLEKEILEYMKYKIIGKTIEFLGKTINIANENDINELCDSSKEVFEDIKKNEVYNEIYSRYFNFSKNIHTLENYAKKIPKNIEKTNNDINSLRGVSTSGSLSNAENLSKKVEAVSDSIESLKANLNSYQKEMEKFRKVIDESKERYESDKISGKYEFSDEINDFVNDEYKVFLAFVDESSEMNRKIEYKLSECDVILRDINDIKITVNYFESAINSIEEELTWAKSQKGEDRDNDYIKDLNEEKKDLQSELSDYIKDMKENIKDIHIETLELEVSTEDHSDKENLLERLVNFKNGILLEAVLDNEELQKINKMDELYNSFDILTANKNLSINKMLLGEYELDKFNYYNKNKNNEITKSASENLEVERLINGKQNDFDNLKSTIDKILLIRIAMNVLHIYTNSRKRQEARAFAYSIFGGFSRLLAEIMFITIITAWGTVQSIADIKKLLKNYKVNFIHNDSSWSVSINSIFDIISGHSMAISEHDDTGCAFKYKDYLRILLINTEQSNINERMASIIEKNIKKEQNNFDFERLVAAFDVNNKWTCRHFFTNLIFMGARDVKLYNEYIIETDGYKNFIK